MSGIAAYNSETGKTDAIANAQITGINPKSIGTIKYYVQVDDPAIAGFLTVIFRWVDRLGNARSHQSTALSLTTATQLSGIAHFYAEDNALGSPLEFEIAVASLLGTLSYSYWYQVFEDDTGN